MRARGPPGPMTRRAGPRRAAAAALVAALAAGGAGAGGRRGLSGHQAENRGEGLAGSAVDPELGYATYQRNHYHDGRYPFDHRSLPGSSSGLGGDWDNRFVEPLPAEELAGAVPAIEELLMHQRGDVVMGIIEELLQLLNFQYCEPEGGGRLYRCATYRQFKTSLWVLIAEELCGGLDAAEYAARAFETWTVQELFQYLLGKCGEPFGKNLEEKAVKVAKTALLQAGFQARPDIAGIIKANEARAQGVHNISATTVEILKRLAEGGGAFEDDLTPHQAAQLEKQRSIAFGDWSQERQVHSTQDVGAFTTMVEQGSYQQCQNAAYLQHPSARARRLDSLHMGPTEDLGWSVNDKRWCSLDHHGRCRLRHAILADTETEQEPYMTLRREGAVEPKAPFVKTCSIEECAANGGKCP